MNSADHVPSGTSRPRGRRPAESGDARADILAAAAAIFAEKGFEGTSMRGVARAADVDPSLVHHYFEGKADLFFQAVTGALYSGPDGQPFAIIDDLASAPRDEMGRRWVLTFLHAWDSPETGSHLRMLVHAVTSDDQAVAPVRRFLHRMIVDAVREFAAPDHIELRGELASSQIIGLGMMRYVGRLPALADATPEHLAAMVGPTIQRYLYDPLPEEILAAHEPQP